MSYSGRASWSAIMWLFQLAAEAASEDDQDSEERPSRFRSLFAAVSKACTLVLLADADGAAAAQNAE